MDASVWRRRDDNTTTSNNLTIDSDHRKLSELPVPIGHITQTTPMNRVRT